MVSPYFFLEKKLTTFFVLVIALWEAFQLSSPRHSHLPTSFIHCSF